MKSMGTIIACAMLVAAVSADVQFSRTISDVAPGNTGEVIITPGCSSKDQFGSNDCDLNWGSTYTASVNATLGQDLGADVTFTVDMKLDGLIPFKFTCHVCGANCTVTVPIVKKTVTFQTGPCPIKATSITKQLPITLPSKSPVPISAGAKGTISLDGNNGKLAQVAVVVKLSPKAIELATEE